MLNKKRKDNLDGFSLFEVLITLSIMMLFAAVAFPIGIKQNQKSKLESYASQISNDIYYQQQRSLLRAIPSGVRLGTHSYTLFDGESFESSEYKDVKTYPQNISITNISLSSSSLEISFEEGSFKPKYYGSFRLTDGTNNISVFINQEGLIEYE